MANLKCISVHEILCAKWNLHAHMHGSALKVETLLLDASCRCIIDIECQRILQHRSVVSCYQQLVGSVDNIVL